MGYARYIGRIGGLAVTLGIGIAVAGMPGAAWAGPEAGSDPSNAPGVSAEPTNTDPAESAGDTPGDDLDGGAGPGEPGDAGDPQGDDDPDESAGGMKVGSSGGAITSTTRGSAGAKSNHKDRDPEPPKRRSSIKVTAPSAPKTVTRSVATAPAQPSRKAEVQPAASAQAPALQAKQAAKPAVVAALSPATATMTVAPEPAAQPVISRVLSLVTLAPGGTQPGSTESPLFLGFLAAGRRASQEASIEDESTARTVGSTENSLMMVAAVANSAPTGTPTMGTPNQATGQITGSVNGVDADGNALTYSVPTSGAGAPTRGTVSVNAQTGAFTYQPSTGSRLAAQTTSAPDFDTFTVNVSDGQMSTPVNVKVAVLPAQPTLVATDTPIALGSGANPSAVATYGNRAYVANATARTVKVINTDTNQVIATIPVETSPSAIAVSPDGKAVWVANSGSKTVQRIDTQSNTVVARVTVGTTPTALAVTADSVWVANAGSNSVSRINTTTNTVVATVNNVGSAPSALAVSGDRVYVANKNGNSVAVISTATNKVVQTKSSVTAPNGLAVSGGKLYVTQQSLNRVLVLNASSLAQVATISVAASPTSVAITPDGAQAYVTTNNHRVSVINTQTNTVVSTAVLTASGTGGHAVAVDSTGTNGKVYISDAVANSLRVMSLTRGNTAPIAVTNPTVEPVNTSNGSVSGFVKIEDTDGDALTYSAAVSPSRGSLTFDAATGRYTYKPTDAARDAAAQNPGLTDTFSFRATDPYGASITTAEIRVTIEPTVAVPNTQIPVTSTPITVGSNPAGVAVAGNHAYVVNTEDYWSGTVTVIDTTTNQVVGNPIPVGYGASRVVASAQGDRVYVATAFEVTVIDTATQQVITTVSVPTQCWECYTGIHDIAVSPDGKRVYAAVLDSTVSVIDTDPQSATYNRVISTSYVPYWEGDIEVSGDGRRLYATEGYGGDSVYVTDTATMQSQRIAIGPQWDLDSMRSETAYGTNNVALSSDRKRAYVTNRVFVVERGVGGQTSGFFISDSRGRNWLVTDEYSVVSVIDTDTTSATYNTEIATIRVPDGASDVAVSSDGSRAYVTHSDGKTVTVIDTATNAVLGTFTTDSTSGAPQSITADPGDGTLYIVDPTDGKVYAVTVGATTAL